MQTIASVSENQAFIALVRMFESILKWSQNWQLQTDDCTANTTVKVKERNSFKKLEGGGGDGGGETSLASLAWSASYIMTYDDFQSVVVTLSFFPKQQFSPSQSFIETHWVSCDDHGFIRWFSLVSLGVTICYHSNNKYTVSIAKDTERPGSQLSWVDAVFKVFILVITIGKETTRVN